MNPTTHFSNPSPVSTHSYTHAGGYYGNDNVPFASASAGCTSSSGAHDQSAWSPYVETYLDPGTQQPYAGVPADVAYSPTSSASNSPLASFPSTGPYSYTGHYVGGHQAGTTYAAPVAQASVSLSSAFGRTPPDESMPCVAQPPIYPPSNHSPTSRATYLDTPPSSQETLPQPSPELVPYTRRNSPAPSTNATPSIDAMRANNWQCPYCPYVQHTRRSPDLKRHIETHTRGKSVTMWVCCGVPAINARELGVPAEVVRTAPILDFEGVPMIGGCRKTFSRRDALARHLRMGKSRGQCYGDPLSMHQPGNRLAMEEI